MFHWIETQSWIPESLHLWIEIGMVIVGVVVAVGAGIMLFSFALAAIAGSFKLVKNFWRWCFLAPIKYAQSWWPVLDDYWEAWSKKREWHRAERHELMKYRKEDRGPDRVAYAFTVDKYTVSCWEKIYLRQRRKGDTFARWFADQMDSLAMTSALTADAALSADPMDRR